MSTKPDPDYALSQQIKAEARSLPDFIEWAVAALIAEGGEIEQAFEEPHYEGDTFAAVEVRGGPGRYLIYGPIPVESAEAKETP